MKTQEFLNSTFLKAIVSFITPITLFMYSIGFIIYTTFLSEHNVSQFEVMNSKYLSTGVLYSILWGTLILIMYGAYRAEVSLKKEDDRPDLRKAINALVVFTIFGFGYTLLFNLIFFFDQSLAIQYSFLPSILGAIFFGAYLSQLLVPNKFHYAFKFLIISGFLFLSAYAFALTQYPKIKMEYAGAQNKQTIIYFDSNFEASNFGSRIVSGDTVSVFHETDDLLYFNINSKSLSLSKKYIVGFVYLD